MSEPRDGVNLRKRLYKGALRKYATFFFSFLLVFFLIASVKKAEAATEIRGESSIVVTASVPLTLEFAYLIQKNSRIFTEKIAYLQGERGEIVVSVRGAKDEGLRNHEVELRMTSLTGAIYLARGKTDVSGNVGFSVVFDELFVGKNTLQAFDTTYGEPLLIKHVSKFFVENRQDTESEDEKNLYEGPAPLFGRAEIENLLTFAAVPLMNEASHQKESGIKAYHPVEEVFPGSSP